jgi:branched-chain amino acid transport system permease protein
MLARLSESIGTFLDLRRILATAVVVAGLLLLAPFFAGPYLLHLLTISLYYVILAASWNLLAGFTGQFSLAHQAFAAVGAYTSGLLIRYYHLPLWLTIPSGVAVAAILGYALGRMVLKLRAIYLAIATWAFAETIHILLTAAFNITRGELGLTVPPLYANVRPDAYYDTFVALAVLSVLVMYLVVASPLGYFMRAIKDDELRAQSLGIDTTRVKIFVFTFSSALAGLAGAFYGHYTLVLSPQMADFSEMAKLIIMVVVGGLGTFLGPLIGAPIIQMLTSYLAKYGEWDMVIFAILVIALMRSYMGGLSALMAVAARRIGLARAARSAP